MLPADADDSDLRWIPPAELLLDPLNPRLAGHHFVAADQDSILEWLWKNKSVNELVDSILSSGFWAHEELFAAEEYGKLVVVEGNRRLAAVKVITDPALRARLRIHNIEEPAVEVRGSIEKLPVLVRTRRQIWQFIGFKHVNGPQEWDSIGKAEYIHRVHKAFGVGLDEIARTIGDRHETVQRLYGGYLVLSQAQEQGIFDLEDSQQRKFPFSHLWTALGYASVREFLGVDSERLRMPNPVPPERLQDLGVFLLWLFGSRKKNIEPKVKRQNPDLRDLAVALGNPRGIQVLRADLSLSVAKEVCLDDERLFQNSFIEAERFLREAKRFVATGYDGETYLLETAVNVEALAKSLRKEMLEISSTGDAE